MNIYLDGRPYSKKKPGQRPIFPAGKKGAVPHFSLQLIEPLGYLDFLKLMAHARVVLTDSGGIQEETTILGTPCLTLRENTERPVTVEMGTNRLVGSDPARILEAYREVMAGNVKRSHPWFLKHGLEWLPRLLQEPRRLWRRTFISAPVFFWHVFKQRIKK